MKHCGPKQEMNSIWTYPVSKVAMSPRPLWGTRNPQDETFQPPPYGTAGSHSNPHSPPSAPQYSSNAISADQHLVSEHLQVGTVAEPPGNESAGWSQPPVHYSPVASGGDEDASSQPHSVGHHEPYLSGRGYGGPISSGYTTRHSQPLMGLEASQYPGHSSIGRYYNGPQMSLPQNDLANVGPPPVFLPNRNYEAYQHYHRRAASPVGLGRSYLPAYPYGQSINGPAQNSMLAMFSGMRYGAGQPAHNTTTGSLAAMSSQQPYFPYQHGQGVPSPCTHPSNSDPRDTNRQFLGGAAPPFSLSTYSTRFYSSEVPNSATAGGAKHHVRQQRAGTVATSAMGQQPSVPRFLALPSRQIQQHSQTLLNAGQLFHGTTGTGSEDGEPLQLFQVAGKKRKARHDSDEEEEKTKSDSDKKYSCPKCGRGRWLTLGSLRHHFNVNRAFEECRIAALIESGHPPEIAMKANASISNGEVSWTKLLRETENGKYFINPIFLVDGYRFSETRPTLTPSPPPERD